MDMLWLLLFLPLTWVISSFLSLYRNYRRAARLGLPRAVAPVSPDNPLWIAFQTGLSPIFQLIPGTKTGWLRYCRLGWEFHDRYKTTMRLGDAWVLVTPARNWLYVGDRTAAYEILARNRDFGRPTWMLGK